MDKSTIKSLCYIKNEAEKLIYSADEIDMNEPEFIWLNLTEIRECCENILDEIKEIGNAVN